MRAILHQRRMLPDGRYAWTYSVAPGRRLTFVADPTLIDPDLTDDLVAKIIALIDPTIRSEHRT